MLRFANVDAAMKYAMELAYNQNCQITMSVVTESHKQHRVTINANMDWQFIHQANEWEWEYNPGREKLDASPSFQALLHEAQAASDFAEYHDNAEGGMLEFADAVDASYAERDRLWAVIQSWYDMADKSIVKFRGVEPIKPAPVTITRFGGITPNALKIKRGKVSA